MSIFNRIFNRKQNTKKVVEEFSEAIVKNTIKGSNKLKAFLKIFNNTFELEQNMKVYLEFVTFQIHVVDKISSGYFGPHFKNELINKTLHKLHLHFNNENSLESSGINKKSFFERHFHEALQTYPHHASLLEKDETYVTLFFTKRLSENIIDKEIVASEYLLKHIHEMQDSFLKELLLQKPFSKLTRRKLTQHV